MGWVAMAPGLRCELSSSQACLSLVGGSLSHVHPAAGRGRSQHTGSSSCQIWMDVTGRAVLSWHWADNSWVLPQTAQSQPWLCCCSIKIPSKLYFLSEIKSWQPTAWSLCETTACLLFRSHLVRMISLPKAGKKIKCSKNIKKVIIVTQCYFLQTLMQQKLRLYVNEETPRKAQGQSEASSMHWNKVLACR